MNANRIIVRTSLGLTLALLPGLVPAAQAVVGHPLTPVSVAGVARRTAYRSTVAVSATSAASASAAASQQQAAAAQQQAAAAQQQAAAAQQQAAASQQAAAQQSGRAAALPPGTTVSALPAGCTTVNISGVDYFSCGGTYYRAAFQSNNVVYVVSTP